MRIATIQTPYGPRAAIQLVDEFIDLHGTDSSLPADVRSLLAMEPALRSTAITAACRSKNVVRYDAENVRFHAPVVNPQKIICIGLNYKDHAAESGVPIPKEPVLFCKFPSALIGHGENIVLPAVSGKVDYEAELVIVVGKRGRHLTMENANEYIAGYTVGHDVSARDWQLEKDGKQWMAGKTFDTFAPCGPVIVTSDEVSDPHNLPIMLRLNGKLMQNSNTKQMIFRANQILAYITQVFTIEPGDLIFTGTPPGVGMAHKPHPLWLKADDEVEVEITGLGVLRNTVVAA